tara:strand:+ start:572 stop:1072 length:501 start_codon:yes stop_codon:yes gene_type:complete
MSEYRERTTGEVKTQGQWRAAFPQMALPRVWKAETLDAMNIDPVLASPAATVGAYQYSARDGVEQDANGNWVEKYVAKDMFSDYTDEDGVSHTKSEQETAYQARLDADTATANRATRDAKLAETDFYALSDVTMSSEMTTYRQALRDITTHENWPNLKDADWPTAP